MTEPYNSGIDLGRVWVGIAAEVWRRHPGPVERTAARLLRSPGATHRNEGRSEY
jgi:hypothetical protein